MYVYIPSTKPLNYAEFATNFLFVIRRRSAAGGFTSIPRYQLSLFSLFCVAVCEHHEYGFNEANTTLRMIHTTTQMRKSTNSVRLVKLLMLKHRN